MDNNFSRRRFLQIAGITAASATMGLVGCGQSRSEDDASASTSSNSSAATSSPDKTEVEESNNASSTSQDPTSQEPASDTKSLVLVFSRADENYGVGTVEVGNTMVLAQMIAEKTASNLFEIERVTAYPASYDACCDEALEEQHADARPELKSMPDISGYDTIYFGFPCWWGDLPMPVYTAIEALDWNGKTISPFNTHAGSGESGMFSTLASKCAGATVTSGLTLSGETAQNDRAEAEASVDSWLSSLG